MIDPSTWIALAALVVSLVFGVLNANHQSNGDVKAAIDDARAEASRQARIESVKYSGYSFYIETEAKDVRQKN